MSITNEKLIGYWDRTNTPLKKEYVFDKTHYHEVVKSAMDRKLREIDLGEEVPGLVNWVLSEGLNYRTKNREISYGFMGERDEKRIIAYWT